MTKFDVGALAFKLAGIYVLAQALPMLQVSGLLLTESAKNTISGTDYNWGILVTVELAPFFLLLCMGYLLIRHSATLARRAFADPDAAASADVKAADLQAVAFAAIGIALIASALQRFTRFAFWAAARSDDVRGIVASLGDSGPELAERSAQLLIGLGLFYGQRGASDLWRKVRTLWLTLRGREP